MEFDKYIARRLIHIAERKISENDYVAAKKFVNMAQSLYPELDGLKQVSTMVNVCISASSKTNGGGEVECNKDEAKKSSGYC
ncbi:unnamed protein product [Thlaspi arvense]|uniref:Uncharacterized protein n=1 Tax=Thlaspi arvense TaxID=13288 RepID=A0AAU9T474_THLAR|nr:unnamed protein product [Thlaspi arvense]